MRLSTDLGVTKMSQTYRPKFRAKSLHVMLDVVSCRPEARTVEDGQGDDAGGSVSIDGGVSMATHREMSWGHRLSAWCAWWRGDLRSCPSVPVSRLVFFLKVCLLACLLAYCGKNRSLSGRQHPTSLSGAPVSCHLEGTSGSLSRLTVAWSV